jgi:hypothetical protein
MRKNFLHENVDAKQTKISTEAQVSYEIEIVMGNGI